MARNIFVLATVLGLLNNTIVFAQKKTITLEQVWQKTLLYYPSINSKKQLIEEQELKKELVKKQFMPDVTVQAQQSYGSAQTISGSFFPLPGIFTTGSSNKTTSEHSAISNLYSSAVLQWNFLQFGREKKKLAVADAAIQLSATSLKQEEWRLLSSVTRIYFATLYNKAALKIASNDTRRLTELFSLLQAQVNAGLRPGADTLLLQSSLFLSQAKEHQQHAALQTNLIQLAAWIGETDRTFTVDTTIFYRFKQSPLVTDDNMQQHPYLQLLKARIKYAETEKEVIKKEVYPSAGLLAGLGIKSSGIQPDGTINKSFGASWRNASGNYLAGFGLTWNFSSLYQNKNKQAISDREIGAAKADHDAVQIQLNAQYAAALSGWDQQLQNLLASEASMKASKEAYLLYEVRYQSGLISLIELLQLQKNLQDAESNYASVVNAYWNELINQAETLGNLSLLLRVIQP